MTLFPDVQRKAQLEVDSITGGTRLPSFADRQNMPYLNAMVKELLRWNPVVPLSEYHIAWEMCAVVNYCRSSASNDTG